MEEGGREGATGVKAAILEQEGVDVVAEENFGGRRRRWW